MFGFLMEIYLGIAFSAFLILDILLSIYYYYYQDRWLPRSERTLYFLT